MRLIHLKSIFILIFLAMGMIACNSNGKASDSPLEEGAEQVQEAISDALRSDREELRADIEETQAAMNENLAALQRKMENASEGATKVELEKQIDALKKYNEKLTTKLENLATVRTEEEFKKFEKDARALLTQTRQSMVDVE